jgi:hypothetical protein
VSVPFFHNVDLEAEIACIRAFYGRDEAPKYPPVRFGEYYLSKHLRAQHMVAEVAELGRSS